MECVFFCMCARSSRPTKSDYNIFDFVLWRIGAAERQVGQRRWWWWRRYDAGAALIVRDAILLSCRACFHDVQLLGIFSECLHFFIAYIRTFCNLIVAESIDWKWTNWLDRSEISGGTHNKSRTKKKKWNRIGRQAQMIFEFHIVEHFSLGLFDLVISVLWHDDADIKICHMHVCMCAIFRPTKYHFLSYRHSSRVFFCWPSFPLYINLSLFELGIWYDSIYSGSNEPIFIRHACAAFIHLHSIKCFVSFDLKCQFEMKLYQQKERSSWYLYAISMGPSNQFVGIVSEQGIKLCSFPPHSAQIIFGVVSYFSWVGDIFSFL